MLIGCNIQFSDRVMELIVDAFNESKNWVADSHLAIDQGPIIVMIENYRSGLLWKLFMNAPEIKDGLKKLGFDSPYLHN